MNINIPDKLYKLLISIGLIIIGYSIISITTLYTEYSLKLIEVNEANRESLIDSYDQISSRLTFSSIFGLLVFIIGFIFWIRDENYPKQFEKTYKCCQSCGKKFSSIRTYGTNKDLSLNFGFCSECMTYGDFSNPELTIADLIVKASEKGYQDKNTFIYQTLEKKLKDLDRWKMHEY